MLTTKATIINMMADDEVIIRFFDVEIRLTAVKKNEDDHQLADALYVITRDVAIFRDHGFSVHENGETSLAGFEAEVSHL